MPATWAASPAVVSTNITTEEPTVSTDSYEIGQGFDNIQLRQLESGIYQLQINRPEALNALNEATLSELSQALQQLGQQMDLRVLLLSGAGNKAFVAGADIRAMSQLSPADAEAFSALGHQVMQQIEHLPVPVIALVSGYALGGGCELALSCDFILASQTAVFAQPEVGLGIVAGFGGSQRLTRQVGKSMAAELLFTGRHVKAEEALRIGLINHLYPAQELMGEGLRLARMIRTKSTSAVQLTKELIQAGLGQTQDLGCVLERRSFALCFGTDDQQQGMQAFLENRTPEFN